MVGGDDGHYAGAGVSVLTLLDQALAMAGVLLLLVGSKRLAQPVSMADSPGLPIREDVVFAGTLAYFGTALVLGVLLKSHAPGDEVLHGLVVNNGAQFAGVAACLILVSRVLPGGVRTFVLGPRSHDEFPRRYPAIEIVLFCVVAIGVCPLIRDATAWLILLANPDFSFDPHPTLKALENAPLFSGRVVLLWLGAAVVAPVAEEVFFRGVLQNFLRVSSGLVASILFTSLAFAGVHFLQPHALPALFFLGLLLGIAYARHRTILVPIAIHAAFNLKTLVWESLSRGA